MQDKVLKVYSFSFLSNSSSISPSFSNHGNNPEWHQSNPASRPTSRSPSPSLRHMQQQAGTRKSTLAQQTSVITQHQDDNRSNVSRSPSPVLQYHAQSSQSAANKQAAAPSRQLPSTAGSSQVHVQQPPRVLPTPQQSVPHHLRKLPPVPGVATRSSQPQPQPQQSAPPQTTQAATTHHRKMPTIQQQPGKVYIIQKIQPSTQQVRSILTTSGSGPAPSDSTSGTSKYLSKQYASVGDDDGDSENETENWL